MKFALASMIALLSVTAFAAQKQEQQSTDVCARFMTCGTYVQAIDAKNPDSVETKITIASTGPMTASFDYTLTNAKGESHTWPLQATFGQEGDVVMRWKGQDIYATAICALNMCNYNLVPFESEKNGIWGNAGLMKFTGTTLEFMMTVGTPTKYRSHDMVLVKQ